ncbi:MAG TPA: MBL fold metallo-hydrolase, partial [Candidatus Acidoferrales bacterium]|nr:MBL fold metallo-hydrolase [Candidatus Acidoferrales bacterium]
MLFRQIQKHGDNFSYIIADEQTHEAAVVDSSYNADEITKIIQTQGLQLKYVISTHGHSDHIIGNTQLRQTFKVAKTVAHKQAKTKSNLQVDDGDNINVGKTTIKIIHTPGHTPDSICLLIDNQKLLTGDTLFVSECGRTNLAGGDPKQLYQSLFQKILKLPDTIEVYPGHNYGTKPSSTIGYERKTN